MLSSYRVLDLSDERGIFCAYLLAHLGAEVIAIEPPGGSSARRRAPFARDSGEPEDSLCWWAYGRGRQSLTLDLSTSAGRERCLELAADADFLIESFEPGRMAGLGLDYQALSERNPGLIVVSISPFGQTGPKAHWPATDLTVWAACGAHSLAGDDDRAPVRTTVPQAFLHAGADAAGAALIALQERHKSGRGQHVDVSAQQSSAQAALGAMQGEPNRGNLTVLRMAGGLKVPLPIRLTWPCRDGYVAITFLFGPAFTEPNRRLLKWVHEHGACSTEDLERDWGAEIAAIVSTQAPPISTSSCATRSSASRRARLVTSCRRGLGTRCLHRSGSGHARPARAEALRGARVLDRAGWPGAPRPVGAGALREALGNTARRALSGPKARERARCPGAPRPGPATYRRPHPLRAPAGRAQGPRLHVGDRRARFCTRVLADYGPPS